MKRQKFIKKYVIIKILRGWKNMKYFEEKLRREKAILDKMVEINSMELSNDFILKQSRKVDRLVVAYQKIKLHSIKVPSHKSIARMSIKANV